MHSDSGNNHSDCRTPEKKNDSRLQGWEVGSHGTLIVSTCRVKGQSKYTYNLYKPYDIPVIPVNY